jgi:hypothetical protein
MNSKVLLLATLAFGGGLLAAAANPLHIESAAGLTVELDAATGRYTFWVPNGFVGR